MRVILWNLMPNGRSAELYSIGALRKQHPDWFKEDLTELLDLLAQNKIKPIIARRMPLAEARHAHELVEQAEVQGKIVLNVAETHLQSSIG
jgi:NADPH:quinone reductase-like Zn-dependent oxidoreductase